VATLPAAASPANAKVTAANAEDIVERELEDPDPMTTRTLGWLHFTDLHVGQPKGAGRLGTIETALLEDLAAESQREEMSFDVVFFTGDIAFRGADREFVDASALLGRLMTAITEINEKVGAAPPVLIPVPGNHDLARPNAADARAIHDAFAGRTSSAPPLWTGAQEGVRERLEACFAGYERWLRDHPLPFPPRWRSGTISGDRVATVRRRGISLGVVGLNSSYLHFGDDAKGKLHLDLRQLEALVGEQPAPWFTSHDFTVLMTHHPPSWLSAVGAKNLAEEIRVHQRFSLHLHGHAHVGAHRTDPGSSGIRHILEGRSLFGAEEDGHPRMHGYGVGRCVIREDDGEPQRQVECWTRTGWSDGSGWRFGSDREEAGRWRIVLELGAAAERDDRADGDTEAPRLIRGLGDPAGLGRKFWSEMRKKGDVEALAEFAERRWIFLSAGVPKSPDDYERRSEEREFLDTAQPEALLEFIALFAARACTEGMGVLFGGQPDITTALTPQILTHARKNPGNKSFALFQSEEYWSQLNSAASVLAAVDGVIPVRTPLDLDLAGMRDLMLAVPGLLGAVFVGGLSGIVEEFHATGRAQPELPRIAVGVGGGAAASLLLDSATRDAAMGAADGKPGVSSEGRLWASPAKAVEAIFEVLRPLLRRS